MNIQEIYDYAKLATLSYVDLSKHSRSGLTAANVISEGKSTDNPGATERIPEVLGKQMLAPTADIPADITGKWTVLDPYFRPSGATGHSDPESGFAAMLVRNDTTGKKVLTIAGTEPSGPGQMVQDLIQADAQQIGLYGIALAQVVSLYNYVQVLRGTGEVDQLVLKRGETPPVGIQSCQIPANPEGGATALYLWIEKTTPATGLGKIDANEQLTVTGHSLGGHLASLAVALFPDVFTSAVTFNAPGYNPPTSLAALGADRLLGLFRQFGANPLSIAGISSRVSTYESEDASTGDDWEFVAGSATGTPFSQEQYLTVERNTHDVGHMLDSLSISGKPQGQRQLPFELTSQ